MIAVARKIDSLIEKLRKIANCYASPVYDLTARLFLANAFWSSGILRFNDWKNGSFDNQIMLFDLEHPVPFLAPEMAAYVTMSAELALPILVAFGLFGRVGAAGLLIITAVIEFTYGHYNAHILWAFLAATIFIKGPGTISLDYFILKFIRKDRGA